MRSLQLKGLSQSMKVLCLGAHSDDIEIGCAAGLLTLIRQVPDLSVCWVVLGADNETRMQEARLSADAWLSGRASLDLRVLAFRDGRFPAARAELKDYFADLGSTFHPDLIFSHSLSDRHQDHRLVAELTWQTWRNQVILEYEIPKFEGDLGHPNLYIQISEVDAEAKIAHLMRHFASQRSKEWFDKDVFRGLMRLRGLECRAPGRFAEAFHARKLVF